MRRPRRGDAMPAPTNLSVNGVTGPLVTTDRVLWFGWTPASTSNAARVRVTKGETVIWESGLVSASDPTMQYGGPPLRSREIYRWAVQTMDADGAASDWSEPSTLEIGLLDDADWSAKWIARAV